MRGIEIFQKLSYREISPMRDRPMRDRPMRGPPVPLFTLYSLAVEFFQEIRDTRVKQNIASGRVKFRDGF